MKQSIRVIIPAYNEEKIIGKTIEEIKRAMDTERFQYKIDVLEDGSDDRNLEIEQEKDVIVNKNNRNWGLAETFKNEMTEMYTSNPNISVDTDAV